jgi:hypothetical protein
MINDAFYALTAKDELMDTMFFGGFDYKYEKLLEGGKKVYQFTCLEFTLKIVGRKITINGRRMKSVTEAKRVIQLEYVI